MSQTEAKAVDDLIAEARQEERCAQITAQAIEKVKQQTLKLRQQENNEYLMENSIDLGSDQRLSVQISPVKSRRASQSKHGESSVKKAVIELSRVRRGSGDYQITNSWDTEIFAPLNYMEKMVLKNQQQQEKERLKKIAELRHTFDQKKRQIMMAEEHEIMTTELMRKQTYQNLVKKNMHDFTRRAKNQILIDRAEKLKKIKE